MAWTAPFTATVGYIFLASDWNTYVRDDLRYLKGMDGAVTISDDLHGGGTATLSQMLTWVNYGGQTLTSPAARNYLLNSGEPGTVDREPTEILITRPGTLRRTSARMKQNTASGTTEVSLYRNNTRVSLFTIPATSTSWAQGATAATVVAGDLIYIQVEVAGTGTIQPGQISVEFK